MQLSSLKYSPERRTIFSLFVLFIAVRVDGREAKVFKYYRNTQVMDETQPRFPNDYNFDEDLKKPADLSDAYDELVPSLPKFEVHKNGKKIGFDRINIVTRSQLTWTTPEPPTKVYKTWGTPKLVPNLVTAPAGEETTTAAPDKEETGVETTPTKHHPSHPSEDKQKNKPFSKKQPLPATTFLSRGTEKPVKGSVERLEMHRMPNELDGSAMPTLSSASLSTPPLTANKQQTMSLLAKLVVAPTEGMQTEKHLVESNSLLLRKQPESTPGVPVKVTTAHPLSKWAWSRSWSVAPDGTLTMKFWDNVHGERVEVVKPKTTTSLPSTTRLPAKIAHKPALIHTAERPYRGPTFNCKILDAEKDGVATKYSDTSCRLSFPGYSADGSCKCTYEVSGRDENGCATGFFYTCTPMEPLRRHVTA